MKNAPLRIIIFIIFVFTYPSSLLAVTEQRTALVIGNSTYSSGPLKNPVNDAADMAANLKKMGFNVTLKTNSSKREMGKAIDEFGKQLKGRDAGLFFYAGHAVQINGVNFLVPVDAKINEESDIEYEAIDAGRVLSTMHNAKSKVNIVILDACRDNPYANKFRSSSRGLAIITKAPMGTIISYSTSPGDVALDGRDRNSPYTSSLIKFINEPGLTVEKVFKKTRQKIINETEGKQVPWELSSLRGDFFFIPRHEDRLGHLAGASAVRQKELQQLRKLEDDANTANQREAEEIAKKEAELAALDKQIAEMKARLGTSAASKDDSLDQVFALAEQKEKQGKQLEALRQQREAEEQKRQQEIEHFKQEALEKRIKQVKADLAKYKRVASSQYARDMKDDAWKAMVANYPEAKQVKTGDVDSFLIALKLTQPDQKEMGRFITYDNGTVLDTKTNLMWAVKDSDRSIDWASAETYCKNYRGGGYTDWRMPRQNELAGLYDKSIKSKQTRAIRHYFAHKPHLYGLIVLNRQWVWASETRGSEAAIFDFINGIRIWDRQSIDQFCGALPVRTYKQEFRKR